MNNKFDLQPTQLIIISPMLLFSICWGFVVSNFITNAQATVLCNRFENNTFNIHDDVIKQKHFPRYWPFVWGMHRWFPTTKASDAELWCFLCAWTNGRAIGTPVMRRHRAHYDVTVIWDFLGKSKPPGGRLNKKNGLTRYGDSHVKDKTS